MSKPNGWKYVFTDYLFLSDKSFADEEMLEGVKEELKVFAEATAEERGLEIKSIEYEITDSKEREGYKEIKIISKMKNKEEKEEKETTEPELEGGGHSWYWVCGECRKIISDRYKYCPGCGRKIKWDDGCGKVNENDG